jgi:hypothetical protein
MALSKFSNDDDTQVDTSEQRLMCFAHGCPNKWSVQIGGGKPLCSAHQWSDSSDWGSITSKLTVDKLLPPTPRTIANYYDPLEGDAF